MMEKNQEKHLEFFRITNGLGSVISRSGSFIKSPISVYPFKYALYIPGLTLLMKLPLVLPPLSGHLYKIRAGFVRGTNNKDNKDTDQPNV